MSRSGPDDRPVSGPSSLAVAVQRGLSPERLGTYQRAMGGDPDRAVDLYLWNSAVAGALWPAIGFVEVLIRNTVHDALSARHAQLGRTGEWYDDPAMELEQRARDDIARAVAGLRRRGEPSRPGKVVAELSFGFWRFLLARRYTAKLWPAIRPGFPYLGGADRLLLEEPITRLHKLRNRVAHHEPLIAEPLADRFADLLGVVGAVDPLLRVWIDESSTLLQTLARRPERA